MRHTRIDVKEIDFIDNEFDLVVFVVALRIPYIFIVYATFYVQALKMMVFW